MVRIGDNAASHNNVSAESGSKTGQYGLSHKNRTPTRKLSGHLFVLQIPTCFGGSPNLGATMFLNITVVYLQTPMGYTGHSDMPTLFLMPSEASLPTCAMVTTLMRMCCFA
jgi:hypothetical protein